MQVGTYPLQRTGRPPGQIFRRTAARRHCI